MADGFDPRLLDRRDLRRLVDEMWTDPRCDHHAPAVLDAAITADATSLDRAVLTAYLRHYPTDHISFDRLRLASELTAERRDWPWRTRGREWRLWDREDGPGRVASALLDWRDAAEVMREAGLDGDLAQGRFVARAIDAACAQTAHTTGNEAIASGEKLIALFEELAIAGKDASLAWALLAPWTAIDPPTDHRDRISKLLANRIGDPRLQQARWSAVAEEMPDPEAARLVATIRRWLTERSVRQFFSVVGATTNDPKQWAAREEFWLAYLDAGMIDGAWFALGRQADAMMDRLASDDADRGEIVGGGADPSHSALIMSIGDVRIAEWSHNGSCRFWDSRDPQAPSLYEARYFGTLLRAMNGGRGFDKRFAAIPHASGWQAKFAGFVHHCAGRAHPRWFSGRDWRTTY